MIGASLYAVPLKCILLTVSDCTSYFCLNEQFSIILRIKNCQKWYAFAFNYCNVPQNIKFIQLLHSAQLVNSF